MWQKGQSGNPEGRTSERIWQNALNRAIAQDDGKRLRKAAEMVLDLAAEGEPWAVKELGDRLDGKAIQPVQADVEMNVVVEMVKFANTDS